VKPLTTSSLSIAVLLTCSAFALAAEPPADDRAIRGLVQAWEEDWNTHDMGAMGTLITEDADFVNVAGLHWKGRPQIVREHAERHRTNLKLSHWITRNVTIQQLSPEVALVHIDWGMTGDTDFDGTPREPRDGIFSWLVLKQNNRWLIRAVQNTNVSPRK
jgi:uncharacterized protein (TIGR02246 family)